MKALREPHGVRRAALAPGGGYTRIGGGRGVAGADGFRPRASHTVLRGLPPVP